jgi:hypothetical protein
MRRRAVDVPPKKKTTPQKRIAQLLRMLSSSGNERRNTFAALERTMRSESISWSDLGNWIEQAGTQAEGKFTEAEMHELAQVARAEGVEAGIKIGMTRARAGGGSNGHLSLPPAAEMAQWCHDRLGRLKDDKQRDFISDMVTITQRRTSLSLGRLGYLASLYIQIGGRTR